MIFAIKVRKSHTIRTYAVERSKSCTALNRTPSNSPASRGEPVVRRFILMPDESPNYNLKCVNPTQYLHAMTLFVTDFEVDGYNSSVLRFFKVKVLTGHCLMELWEERNDLLVEKNCRLSRQL